MEVVYECCCGLDVHAKTVVACLVTKGRKEIRTFATMTDELLAAGGLAEQCGLHARGDREHGGVLEAGVQHS